MIMPTPPQSRLFLAVWPPPEVVADLAALPRPERPGLRWTPAAQWHMTLRFFGDAEVEEARAVSGSALGAAALAGPVVARLGPEVGRYGHRVLQVPVGGLEPLAAVFIPATAGVGRPPERRPFSGHLTLARQRGRGSLSELVGTRIAGSWRVGEVTLVASVPAGRPGMANRYEVVESYPLS